MKFWILFPFAAILATAACNTVEGVGRDVEAGGEAISDTANAAEREITQ